MELHDVTAALLDRRKEVDALTEKCKRTSDRLHHAEEDASTIEKRSSETSKELVHAGNKLLDIERKSKAAMDKLDQLNQEVGAKATKLSEVERQCNETTQKMEKVDKELESKMDQIGKAEKNLAEVEEKLKLSLKLCELREVISTTEKDEFEKTERRVSALKDGEKILVERTSQLARTRNELQKQTAEYHELNANITLARKDLSRLELAVKKKNLEIEELAARREEERAYHENVLVETDEKLQEITIARNDVLTALRRNRDELLGVRENIHNTEEKASKLEHEYKAKEEEYNKLCQKVEEQNILVESLFVKNKEKTIEMNNLEVELEQKNNQRENVSSELKSAVEEYEQLQKTKEDLEMEIQEMKEKVNSLQSELLSNEQLAADTMTSLEQAQTKLGQTENDVLEKERTRELLVQQMNSLKKEIADCKAELDNLANKKNRVHDDLQQEQKKFQETKTNYEEFEAEFKNLQSELEKRQNDLKQELEKEKNVKPNVQKASGTNVRPMRRKRQGAKLPIVIKTGGLKSSQAKDGGTTNIIRQEDLGESDVQNKDEERTEDNSSEADISGNTVSDDFQFRVQELTAEKDKTRQALKSSVLEVKRLKTQIETEKEKAQSTVDIVATEANGYRRALEHLKIEFAQYQQRASRDVEYLRAEAAAQYSIAQKLAQEIDASKQQQSMHQKHDEEPQQTFTKETMDAVATQIKSEIIQSLKEVEQSREDTIQDINSLKQAKEEIEMQLVTMQHSLLETQAKERKKTPIRDTEPESFPKQQHKSKVFLKEQGYLKDQLRKQMSRRAEILEEERKKAGQSLEGLKHKLKQLEQVITRKDSTVQDFRLELAKTRIEKERSEDKEKELDDMRRKLQEVETERDMVKTERDHFATLSSHVPSNSVSMTSSGGHPTTVAKHVSRSVTSPTSDKRFASSSRLHRNGFSYDEAESDEENVLRLLAQTLSKESSTRSVDRRDKRRRNFKAKYRTPDKAVALRDLEIDHEFQNKPDKQVFGHESLSRTSRMFSPFETLSSGSVPKSIKPSHFDGCNSINLDDTFVNSSDIQRQAYEVIPKPTEETRKRNRSQETRALSKDDLGDYVMRGKDKHGPLSLNKKSIEMDEERSGANSNLTGSLTMSSIAEDKKTKFLASVTRLKNEKLKELEIGLQQFKAIRNGSMHDL